MSTNNIAESIFDSISLIVEKRIANLAYDKTVIGTIVDVSNAKKNIYVVSDGSIKFNAQGDGGQYAVNDQVRVLIIDGDYSKEKFIQGKYSADEDSAPITYVSPFDAVVNITDNLSSSNTTVIYGITANDANAKEIPIETIDLTSVINENIYDTLSIRAEFQTNFNGLDMRSGGYGIHIKLNIEKTDEDQKIIRDRLDLYFSSSRDMIGNPYAYKIYTAQEQTYQFSQWPTGTIVSAELFLYQENDFTYFNPDSGEVENFIGEQIDGINLHNIQVKNVYFGFGSELAAIDDNKVEIYTNDTLNFTKKNTDDIITKSIALLWYNKTEDNKYIGFGDGLYDPDYSEQEYLDLVTYNQRLLAQKTNTKIPHDENCLGLAADIADMKVYITTLQSLIGKDLHAVLQGFKRYLTGVGWSDDVSPFDALLSSEQTTSVGQLAASLNNNGTRLEDIYKNILEHAKAPTEVAVLEEIESEAYLTTIHAPFGDANTETSIVNTLHQALNTMLESIEEVVRTTYKNFIDTFETYERRISDIMLKIDAQAEKLYAIWPNNPAKLWQLCGEEPTIGAEYKDLRSDDVFAEQYDNRYCIYWYRYDAEKLTIDSLLNKANWERLSEYDNYGLPILDSGIIPETGYYDKKPSANNPRGIIKPEMRLKTEEHFQAVIFYNHTSYISNILTFTNSVNIEELLADKAGAFYLEHGEYSRASYQSYSEYGTLINAIDAQLSRKLIAHFDGESGGDECLIGTTLYWYVPKNNTMISTHSAELTQFTHLANVNDSAYLPGYDCYYQTVSHIIDGEAEQEQSIPQAVDSAKTYLPYHIKDYYQASATNNTILCRVQIGDIKYETEIHLSFTSFGTNGTDYTLALLPNPQYPVVTSDDPLLVYTRLFDYNNNEIAIPQIDDMTTSISTQWVGNVSGYDNDSSLVDGVLIGYNISKTDSPYYTGILKCSISNMNIEGFSQTINLTSYLPISYADTRTFYMEGPTSIIYDNFGANPSYYRHAYKLYNQGHNEITVDAEGNEVQWHIKYYYKSVSGWTYYTIEIDENGIRTPKDANGNSFPITTNDDKKIYRGLSVEYVPILTNENTLQVSSMYLSLDEEHQIYPVVFAMSGDMVLWAQPLLILQNKYASPVINKWDGGLQLDENNGTILAPMIGAGRKDADNKFEGILMGDVATKSGDDSINAIGLYGYNAGEQSFGFKVDGTAFLGKAGKGRIIMNGDSGTIESANYAFGALTPIQSGAEYDSSKTYYYMNSMGDIVEYVGSAVEATWSDDLNNKKMYVRDSASSGTKIDLDDGWISIKGDGEEKILLDSATVGKPYFKLGTDKTASLIYDKTGIFDIKYGDTSVFHIDQDNTDNPEYYLKTKNYVENTSGVRLDLANGELLANTFRLKANDNLLLSNNASDNYYLQLGEVGTTNESTSNSLVYNKEGDFILAHGNKPLLKVSDDEYYLQTVDYRDNTSGVKIDLKNNAILANAFTIQATNLLLDSEGSNGKYFYVGNNNGYLQYSTDGTLQLVSDTIPLLKISDSEYYLQSKDYKAADPSTGMQINLLEGSITSYDFTLTSGVFSLSTTHREITAETMSNWYKQDSMGPVFFKAGDNFAVTQNGYLFANSGYFTGTIHALAGGTIGGWTISANGLYTSNFGVGSTNSVHIYSKGNLDTGVSIGSSSSKTDWRLIIGKNFGVDTNGAMYATKGKIANWTIDSHKLYTAEATVGTENSFHMYADATGSGYIGENLRDDLMLTIGKNFAVDKSGSLYAFNGYIGPLTVTSDYVQIYKPMNIEETHTNLTPTTTSDWVIKWDSSGMKEGTIYGLDYYFQADKLNTGGALVYTKDVTVPSGNRHVGGLKATVLEYRISIPKKDKITFSFSGLSSGCYGVAIFTQTVNYNLAQQSTYAYDVWRKVASNDTQYTFDNTQRANQIYLRLYGTSQSQNTVLTVTINRDISTCKITSSGISGRFNGQRLTSWDTCTHWLGINSNGEIVAYSTSQS